MNNALQIRDILSTHYGVDRPKHTDILRVLAVLRNHPDGFHPVGDHAAYACGWVFGAPGHS